MLVAKSQLINPALFGTCQKPLNPEMRWKVDAQKFPSAGQADSDIMEIGQRPLDAAWSVSVIKKLAAKVKLKANRIKIDSVLVTFPIYITNVSSSIRRR